MADPYFPPTSLFAPALAALPPGDDLAPEPTSSDLYALAGLLMSVNSAMYRWRIGSVHERLVLDDFIERLTKESGLMETAARALHGELDEATWQQLQEPPADED